MDSLTHVYFAHKLLQMSGGDESAAVCSLFPQIDRQPAYFHRMYGHPFFQIARLRDVGSQVYRTGAVPPSLSDDYAAERFLQERDRMIGCVLQFEAETGHRISSYRADAASVTLAYVSHTYQDIFNNPMQAFLPLSVYPCGQWELWSELDAIAFRLQLYHPTNISAFREEFFGHSIWQTRLPLEALVMAMISSTASASVVHVPRSVIDAAFESLNLRAPAQGDVAASREWLAAHENLLSELIRRYARRVTDQEGDRIAAFQPVPS